jgi:hypothetical protein
MSDHDKKRDFVEPAPSRRPIRTELTGWGVPLAVAAIVFVAGMLVFSFTGTDRTYTASNRERVLVPAPDPQQPRPAVR